MELIESKTLGTAAASIEFTSIPQTFTDICFLVSPRLTGSTDTLLFAFNSSTSNFSGRFLQGNGAAASSSTFSGSTARFAGSAPGTDFTASTFGNNSVYIPNYTGSTNKSYSLDYTIENNATTGFQGIIAGLWSDTSAITSVSFTPNSGNFATGTIISLYGILKGSDGIVTTS
jgi:hypothetical protein